MKFNKILPALICTSAIGASTQAQAGLITFEDQLVIGTTITTQYQFSDGVIFNTDFNGNTPKIGGFNDAGVEGYVYNPISGQNDPDTFRPGLPTEGLTSGRRFITDIIGIKPTSAALSVSYVNPVASLSFDLLDIDGYQTFLDQSGGSTIESYLIEIFNSSNVLLDSISVSAGVALSGVPTGVDSFGKTVGDGIVSRFGFARGVNEITYLKITGSRPAGGFGLAFDNFATDSFTNNVPEPASLALLGTGLLGMAFARRRKSV